MGSKPGFCKMEEVMYELMVQNRQDPCHGCTMKDMFCHNYHIDLNRNDRINTRLKCHRCGQHTIQVVGTNMRNDRYVLKCQNKKCTDQGMPYFEMDKYEFVRRYIGYKDANGIVREPATKHPKGPKYLGGNKSAEIKQQQRHREINQEIFGRPTIEPEPEYELKWMGKKGWTRVKKTS